MPVKITAAEYAALSRSHAIPEGELAAALEAAWQDILAMTYDRAAADLTDFQTEVLRRCVVEQADFRAQYAALLDNPLASYSLNGVSMSWDNNRLRQLGGVYTSPRVEAQLIRTGLLYRGVR